MKILGSPVICLLVLFTFTIFLVKYWQLLKGFPMKFRIIIFLLRTLTLITLLFLLVNPWVSFRQKEQLPQQIAVIFDLSESVKVHFAKDNILPENIKGEFTVVLSEKIIDKNIKVTINESVKIEIAKMLKKYSHKDVVEFISKKENLPKKIIYNYCLEIKK